MRPDSIIKLNVTTEPHSELAKAISLFIEQRRKQRDELQNEFDKKINNQIKKVEQGRI